MSDEATADEQKWPTHCEECGTELQSAHMTLSGGDLGGAEVGTVVTQDFCPNPNCSRHDADLAQSSAPDGTDIANWPGSMGGDNGGA